MSIAQLRKQRSYLKGRLTTIEKFIGVSNKNDTLTPAVIDIRKEAAINTFSQFQSLVPLLMDVVPEAEYEEQDLAETIEFEERYFVILENLSQLRMDCESAQETQPTPPSAGTDPAVVQILEQQSALLQSLTSLTSGSSPTNNSLVEVLDRQQQLLERLSSNYHSNQSTFQNSVKLPTIKLPTFDGNIENWRTFSDSFKTLIHNSSLSDVQKHQYLISSLTGPASKTIESIEISEQNYHVAWKLLTDRFDNEKLLHKRHIQCIFDMPSATRENSQQLQNLIDHVTKHLRVLQAMKRPTESWSDLIVHMIESRIDKITRKLWEEHIEETTHPTIDQILEFLQRRCHILDRAAIDHSDHDGKSVNRIRMQSKSFQSSNSNTSLTTSTEMGRCFFCKENHFIYSCPSFLNLSVADRIRQVKSLKLCLNCLKNDHYLRSCKSGACRKCGAKHNTLCHIENPNSGSKGFSGGQQSAHSTASNSKAFVSTQSSSADSISPSSSHASSANYHIDRSTGHIVLMATAIIHAQSIGAKPRAIPIRALLDSASDCNFITANACKRLNLKLSHTSESVTGLNQISCNIKKQCNVLLSSRLNDFAFNASCLVVPSITKQLPAAAIQSDKLPIPLNLKLADPSFFEPSQIDVLIGAEFFFNILQPGKMALGGKSPTLQSSTFGWLVVGKVPSSLLSWGLRSVQATSHVSCLLSQSQSLENSITKFWEIEDYANHKKPALSVDEIACENHFQNTYKRDQSGRFIVQLPFKSSPTMLGESKNIAIKRFEYLERKFKANPKLHESYNQFMQEYLELSHMTKMSDFGSDNTVYLPHHGVFQESGGNTKLRVVFDASAKTNSGVSLNETLFIGPTLQDTIIDILLRFRIPVIAITGDLRKMYRQILIDEPDRNFQRIIWRFNTSEPLQSYRLNTVTYGQSCAPYLAIRCVRKLAEDSQDAFPLAAHVLLSDLYVDDVLTGVSNEKEAKELLHQVSALLSTAGFSLHKLRSNATKIQTETNTGASDNSASFYEPNDVLKTLGVTWNTTSDNLHFKLNFSNKISTKRQLLSSISQLFDPLGIVSPILIKAKIIMQSTWELKIGWDEILPEQLRNKWEHYINDLGQNDDIKVPRRITAFKNVSTYTLHAFCDASTRAYGACVYLQTTDVNGSITSSLLCSKSRVAPVKSSTITLPRLELCGALILTRLVNAVKTALRVPLIDLHAWTDSTIVLAWISGDPSKQKPFVSNRSAEIQSTLPSLNWHHVKSNDNPADLITRGCCLNELMNNNQWWSGPSWLNNFKSHLKETQQGVLSKEETNAIQFEMKRDSRICIVVDKSNSSNEIIMQLVNKHSSLITIQRILGFVFRFICNTKTRTANRTKGLLSVGELESAHETILKAVQLTEFSSEISALKRQLNMGLSSKLKSLSPFIDGNGLLRVGGRIENSLSNFNQKHPIILPAKNIYTKLIFRHEHMRLNHAGPQSLLFSIRCRYWPVRGRDIARQTVQNCVVCARHRAKLSVQLMGQLPADRVVPSRPFSVTGVDFAGPITTLQSKGRGRKTSKSYIAIFICWATKAVHLEAVSELSTDAFMACLRRFIGRRGCPNTVWSDNGTNFVGAERELAAVYKLLTEQHSALNQQFYLPNYLSWKFIPPSAPHMGGLWEAGVKSCKYHLRRIMGNTLFTFEELTTALIQIEACLNSRPLFRLSSMPDDLTPLSPGHFLVGGTLTSLPEIEVSNVPMSRLNRWQIIQKTTQEFWRRWSGEYLTSLQGKTKWFRERENILVNDVVLISDPNAPPLKWTLGVVIEVHPGPDGRVRVVTLRTATGLCKRPLTKLCKLPIQEPSSN